MPLSIFFEINPLGFWIAPVNGREWPFDRSSRSKIIKHHITVPGKLKGILSVADYALSIGWTRIHYHQFLPPIDFDNNLERLRHVNIYTQIRMIAKKQTYESIKQMVQAYEAVAPNKTRYRIYQVAYDEKGKFIWIKHEWKFNTYKSIETFLNLVRNHVEDEAYLHKV